MNREELQQGLEALEEERREGRLTFAEGSDIVSSLKAVRRDSGGAVDPESVDESVQGLIKAVCFLRDEEKLRALPLAEIQDDYFRALEKPFGETYRIMQQRESDPYEAALAVCHNPDNLQAWSGAQDEFVPLIKAFWEERAGALYSHLEAMEGLKVFYGGDVFPSYASDIVSSLALYADTVVLPDPLIVVSQFSSMPTEGQLFFAAKHALNALRYRDLALADTDPPIVVVAPEPFLFDDKHQQVLHEETSADLAAYLSDLFGRSFESVPDALDFLKGFSDIDAVVAEVAQPELMLWDIEQPRDPRTQMELCIEDGRRLFQYDVLEHGVGGAAFFIALGRLRMANATVLSSARFGASPLVEAPTSWEYLLWKYRRDADSSGGADGADKDAVVARALQVAGESGMDLLADIPASALVDIRKKGVLADLRSTLTSGINELRDADADTVADVAAEVVANLESAFTDHQARVRALSKGTAKLLLVDVPFSIAYAALALAAATGTNPALLRTAALAGVLGVPSLKSVYMHGRRVFDMWRRRSRDPVAICFRHVKMRS